MEEVIKKTFKIFLILLIVNVIIATIVGFVIGDLSILRFVEVSSNSYEIHGILTTSFFFVMVFVIYIILYIINPLIFNFFAKNIPLYYKMAKFFSCIYGIKAVDDIEKDPKLFLKKVISAFIIFFWIWIILFNLLMIEAVQKIFSSSPLIPAFMFIAVVLSFFVFIPLIYKWI